MIAPKPTTFSQDQPRRGTFLCLDLGGTKISAGVVQFSGSADSSPHVIYVGEIPTRASLGGKTVLNRLAGFARDLLEVILANDTEHTLSPHLDSSSDIHLPEPLKISMVTKLTHLSAVDGIGIASPGVVDPVSGTILSATNLLPGWSGQNVYAAFREFTDLPIRLVQDVGAHGLGEATFGAGRNFSRLMSVGVGTGIGGALVVDGQLIQGANKVAGHLGHTCHALAANFQCSCGSTAGHIEAVASGTGLVALFNERAREAGLPSMDSGGQIGKAALSGNIFARKTLIDTGIALGQTIGGIANVFDPQAIVFSGSVASSKIWFKAVCQGFQESALPLLQDTSLLLSELTQRAPLVGAAIEVERMLQ